MTDEPSAFNRDHAAEMAGEEYRKAAEPAADEIAAAAAWHASLDVSDKMTLEAFHGAARS